MYGGPRQVVDQFTICVLLYGNHYDLARRCITSIVGSGLPEGVSLRIGLNAVCADTQRFVRATCPQAMFFEHAINRHKYPVMRDMVHGKHRVDTPYFMWFDDDSYLTRPLDEFLSTVAAAIQTADLLGSPYTMKWRGNQKAFVRSRSWYAGKDPATRDVLRFMTGGWWTIRTQLLYRFDYPWTELDHCGGDSMLGELCYQQDLRMQKFRTGVCINADWQGRESASDRRGFAQDPLGTDFVPVVAPLTLSPIVRL